jgi:hypothetical protein
MLSPVLISIYKETGTVVHAKSAETWKMLHYGMLFHHSSPGWGFLSKTGCPIMGCIRLCFFFSHSSETLMIGSSHG